jgi:branched-chain amino acid transport system ATP-binding protein
MSQEVLLRVQKLTKVFGGIMAVCDMELEVRRGEFLGIIGPNGSGKTTLINLITGFVKPTSGKVLYRGQDITGKQPYRIACLGIARTFQMARTLQRLPAFKNIIVPLCSPRVTKFRGGKYGERDDVAIDILDDLGFERDSFVPYKMAGALPHGYLKRLDLARCIALRPDLLILDELFSGMAMSEVAATLPMLEKFHREGLTIIMVEHRLRELFRVADRVMVMNFGQKIADGPPQEVMEQEQVQRAYLGTEVED